MIAAANLILIVLLSLLPGKGHRADPHGLHAFTEDALIREMLTEGRFGEFDAAVESFVSTRAMIDLKLKRQPDLSRTSSGGSLLDLIQLAARVATFAAELKTLGPVKGLVQAARWVESGVIRRSGVKQRDFPSFFSIVGRQGLKALAPGDLDALDMDLNSSRQVMDQSYQRALRELREREPSARQSLTGGFSHR